MNKLFGLFLLALAFLAPVPAEAACAGGNCFWIGGAGTLDNSTDGAHWSVTSGGGTCSCVPATTDTITFDASSGTGTVTLAVGGGTWTIASLTLSNFNGTFDNSVNNNNITMTGSFTNASSVVRTLNMGSGTWTISGSGSLWNIITSTNLTLSAASSTIAFTAVGSTSQRRFFGGGKTYGTLSISSTTSGSFAVSNPSGTIGTLTTSAPNRLLFANGSTTTVTTFTNLTCNSTNQCLVESDDTSGTAVATVSSANNWTCTYCAINQMTFSGGGTFTGTNSFNTGTNTGIAITPPSGGGGGGRIIGG